MGRFKRGTYWAGTGTYQAEFKRLRSALVPIDGAADTPHGELLRAVGHVYTDLKRTGLRNVDACWPHWHTVYAHRADLIAALGTEGPWVFAVVDRAVTARYLSAKYGDGDDAADVVPEATAADAPTADVTIEAASDDDVAADVEAEAETDCTAVPPRRFPCDAFERLIDACILTVGARQPVAA